MVIANETDTKTINKGLARLRHRIYLGLALFVFCFILFDRLDFSSITPILLLLIGVTIVFIGFFCVVVLYSSCPRCKIPYHTRSGIMFIPILRWTCAHCGLALIERYKHPSEHNNVINRDSFD